MTNSCSPRRLGLAVAILTALLATSDLAAQETIAPDVAVSRDIMVQMRDGARLAADIYRPAGKGQAAAGRFPAILLRTLGGKQNIQAIFDVSMFVGRGYVVVAQDVRGLYKSEGSFYHGRNEAEDGFDTIEWIARQPWSNGKVGMSGVSYMAAVQTAAAALNPAHLTSLFHVESPTSYYHDGLRQGGTYLLFVLRSAFQFARFSKEARSDPSLAEAIMQDWFSLFDWLYRMPVRKGLTSLSHVPDAEAFLLEPFHNPDYGEFWTRVPLWEPLHYLASFADTAGYYFGGWYDPYNEDLFYRALVRRNKRPTKLIMGPWTHGQPHPGLPGYAGEVDFGPEAVMRGEEYSGLQLRWFDQTMKDKDNGILDEPRVKIFVMGGGDCTKNRDNRHQHGGRWRLENEWPLARTQYVNYYFHRGGLLKPRLPDGHSDSTTYAYDPGSPVPTIGAKYPFWTSGWLRWQEPNLLNRQPEKEVPYGPYDQRENVRFFGCNTSLPLSSRQDVLVFQTLPLAQDVEVTGPIVVHLKASSSAVDTDFTAKLIDAHPSNRDYPGGFAMNLKDSILRARYRNGFTKGELMKPGEVYAFTIPLGSTSNVFRKGHRIRVDISSSSFPQYDRNPNTGEPYMTGKKIVAENTIHHSASYPSYVTLPIVPAELSRSK